LSHHEGREEHEGFFGAGLKPALTLILRGLRDLRGKDFNLDLVAASLLKFHCGY
jgi:hypothetical protein